MKKAIIIGSGQKPNKKALNYLIKKGVTEIIAADGGADHLRKLKIIPSAIMGDFDSIRSKSREYYGDKCVFISISRQDDTDIEKALKYIIENEYTEVYLFSVTGKRLDHTFCNLSFLIKYQSKIHIKIIDKLQYIAAYNKDVEFPTVPNEIISFYGITELTKITTEGLEYPLTEAILPFGVRDSTSNVALSECIKFKIKDGSIIIFRNIETAINNDFLFYI